MSLYFALPGALAYGLADFAGGLATRRAPVFLVTAVVQVAGLVALLPAVPLAGGTPVVGGGRLGRARRGGRHRRPAAVPAGARGGADGGGGAAVGRGRRGPAAAGGARSAGSGSGPVTLVAIGIALVAIVLATAGGKRGTGGRLGPLMALGAGAGFALFFVGLHASPGGLRDVAAAGRTAGVGAALVLVAAADRAACGPGAGFPWRLAVFSGVFDTARQRVLPARHPRRRPGRERGGGVALPGGGRAARRGGAAGAAHRGCSSAGRASRWARACCWRSGG